MLFSRRALLAAVVAPQHARKFHVSVSRDLADRDPELPGVMRAAGVTDVWLAGFLYGHWYSAPESIAAQRKPWERAGMRTHVIHIPLGHPGDSLGSPSVQSIAIPPPHWKPGLGSDGKLLTRESCRWTSSDPRVATVDARPGGAVLLSVGPGATTVSRTMRVTSTVTSTRFGPFAMAPCFLM